MYELLPLPAKCWNSENEESYSLYVYSQREPLDMIRHCLQQQMNERSEVRRH
jgi:hypothetical protein